MPRKIKVESKVLEKNNNIAQKNRNMFDEYNVRVLNLVSSPGSGKTSLLEKTIKNLHNDIDIYVIEGDQKTSRDSERVQKAGAKAFQVNTNNACHLDANMVKKAFKKLKPKKGALVFIENVGNLICPSMFDLGEHSRIVMISVTEGEDKPIKYPNMFFSSDICVINKIDLIPHLDFDIEQLKKFAKQINNELKFFEVSAKSGKGMNQWYDWLENNYKLS